jgi:hypothetical protein
MPEHPACRPFLRILHADHACVPCMQTILVLPACRPDLRILHADHACVPCMQTILVHPECTYRLRQAAHHHFSSYPAHPAATSASVADMVTVLLLVDCIAPSSAHCPLLICPVLPCMTHVSPFA